MSLLRGSLFLAVTLAWGTSFFGAGKLPATAAGAGDLELKIARQSVVDQSDEEHERYINAQVGDILKRMGDPTPAQEAAVRRIVKTHLDAKRAFQNNEEFRKEWAAASKELTECHKSGNMARILKAQKDYEALYAPEREFQKKYEADLKAIFTPEQDLKTFAVYLKSQLRDKGVYAVVAARITDEQIKQVYEACKDLDEAARMQKGAQMLRYGKDRILTPEQELAWLKAEMLGHDGSALNARGNQLTLKIGTQPKHVQLTGEQSKRVKAKFEHVLAEMQKEAKAKGSYLRHEAWTEISKKVHDFMVKEVLTDQQRKTWEDRKTPPKSKDIPAQKK